jgi:hypothetical protein
VLSETLLLPMGTNLLDYWHIAVNIKTFRELSDWFVGILTVDAVIFGFGVIMVRLSIIMLV